MAAKAGELAEGGLARRPTGMRKQPIPAREDWCDLGIDPEVRSAYRRYGGRSRDEALPLFAASPIERAAELRFAPTAVFNDYVFCFAAVLSSRAGAGAADAASCFVRLVRDRLRIDAAGVAAIYPALKPAIDLVAERQAFFDADGDIYGSFSDIAQEIEAALAMGRQTP
jgi:hypothetical protein